MESMSTLKRNRLALTCAESSSALQGHQAVPRSCAFCTLFPRGIAAHEVEYRKDKKMKHTSTSGAAQPVTERHGLGSVWPKPQEACWWQRLEPKR